MPSKTTLFDHRAQPIYEIGSGARNAVKYSPSGRFFFVAGFGNLTGDMDIWERKSFKKITTVSASNSSSCEWSADGRFIMTSILYRRLKVDNGIKIWHYTGVLAHQVDAKEMYQVSWRPDPKSTWPEKRSNSPVPVGIMPAEPKKPVGRYRPPGARDSPDTTTLYDREAIDRGFIGRTSKSSIPGLQKPNTIRGYQKNSTNPRCQPSNPDPSRAVQSTLKKRSRTLKKSYDKSKT